MLTRVLRQARIARSVPRISGRQAAMSRLVRQSTAHQGSSLPTLRLATLLMAARHALLWVNTRRVGPSLGVSDARLACNPTLLA